MITEAMLKQCRWRAVLFGDGEDGAAFQVRKCVEHPRLTLMWSRKNGTDPGTSLLAVDGEEVIDLAGAAKRLSEGEP